MTEIKTWAVVLCVSLIVSSVVLFISPEGSMKKFLSYIISVYILTVVLLPLTNADFSKIIGFSEEKNILPDEEYSVMLNEYIYDNSEKLLTDNIKQELDRICSEEYIVNVRMSENGNQIKVESIEILISGIDVRNISMIRKITGELTGIIPKVNTYELQTDN